MSLYCAIQLKLDWLQTVYAYINPFPDTDKYMNPF